MAEKYPIDLGSGFRAVLVRNEAGDVSHVGIKRGTYEHYYALPIRGVMTTDRPSWELVSEDPLTLTPSVHLVGVFHGYIRDEAWSEA